MWRHSDLVYIKEIPGKDRGVFARKAIAPGAIIERVPVVVVPLENIRGVDNRPTLSRYCFLRTSTTVGIALGYGSLYNHSFKPNAHYEEAPDATMIFRALRGIVKGEEITINYNGDPEDGAPVGFRVK